MPRSKMLRPTTAFAFLLGLALGFAAAVAIASAVDAGKASKMKRSIGDARSLSIALERYRHVYGSYPSSRRDAGDLRLALVPKYLSGIPSNTLSGRPYVVLYEGPSPVVVGLGRGGFIVRNGSIGSCEPYTTEGCR